ncbi:TolC family protein [uncultured Chryseobacterium sp.]|uniref:TolC family protein n=1 Tax=uncultured Chryseobacterium sp. TaxID=259322 RepID=UPI00262FDDA9|nr:TolC family protein [uncultured Chryseobacterium sp.]
MRNKLFNLIAVTAVSAFAFAQQGFTIDEAWQYAVENNVNVKKAKIDQTIAEQKVKETIGIGLPQVDAQGKYTNYLNVPVQLLPAEIVGGPAGTYVPVQFGQKHSGNAALTLSQILFSGSYLVGLESSKAYKETVALATEKTEISVKQGILMAYTGVLVTDENLKTLEENRKVAEKALRDTEATYKVGLIELQNVEQQQYGYKSLVANQQNLVRTRDQLAMALKYLMGYPLNEQIALTSNLADVVDRNENLINTAVNPDLSNHIDYRLRENALKLSELKLKLQRSKYLPTLAAFANTSYNGNSNSFGDLWKGKWYNTSLWGLQLDIPIFSGFQRKWQTEQAKLDVEKAKLDLDESSRLLQNNAFSASTDYENAYNSFKNAEDLIALSSSIYKKEQIKFKEGMGTSFTLQQAETQLYDAQRQYYQAALNLIQAKTALDEALGKL